MCLLHSTLVSGLHIGSFPRSIIAPRNSFTGIMYAQEGDTLTKQEFIEKYCHNCGSQRCEGIGTPWFEGCQMKDQLTETNEEEQKNESMD